MVQFRTVSSRAAVAAPFRKQHKPHFVNGPDGDRILIQGSSVRHISKNAFTFKRSSTQPLHVPCQTNIRTSRNTSGRRATTCLNLWAKYPHEFPHISKATTVPQSICSPGDTRGMQARLVLTKIVRLEAVLMHSNEPAVFASHQYQ